jgi:cation transport ATPase
MALARRVEYGAHRKMRTRNTVLYRTLHWPLWIFVFFLVPGPLVFDLFAGRANRWNLIWLALVLVGTGLAALRGRLPGAEPGPYILRFTEDRPNPLYRRVCYTFGWNAALNFALMNLVGCFVAVVTGHWYMQQIYTRVYFPVLAVVLLLGSMGVLPRVRASTAGEGTERRYFYGTVWSATVGQAVLMLLWQMLPRTHAADIAKLVVYAAVLACMAAAAAAGYLPRTRPILPGELIVAD